jgi:PHP family Zn ribbon phosphoesterase
MKYLYTVDELIAMAARPANGFGCDQCGRLWHTARPGLSVPVTEPSDADCRHPTLRPAYITEERQP